MEGMSRTFPILPLRDIVVFPHRIVPLFVGRDKSVAALEAAMAADKELFLVAQLDPSEDDPDRDALYELGVIATAMQLLKLPDGTVRVLVEGAKRARLTNLVERGDYLAAEVEEVDEETAEGPEAQALMTKYFGAIPRGKVNVPAAADVPTLDAPKSLVFKDKVPTVELQRRWVVPGITSPQLAALDLGASVLGGLASSRLDRILVKEEKLAVAVSADMGRIGCRGSDICSGLFSPDTKPYSNGSR